MPSNLRLAKPSDAAALAQLRYDFRASTGIATEPEAEFVERCSAWMTAHLTTGAYGNVGWPSPNKSWAPCGCNWLRKSPTRELSHEHHAYITNFYLRESARGQGTGTRLLTMALDWCRAREVHAVILWPSEKSRTLYERHGFAVRLGPA
jgi:GNAT superfamily N-acetyltransferase